MRSQGTRESLVFFWRSFEDSKVSGEREHSVFYLIFENDRQRARFCKDVGGCESNDLGCDAPSRQMRRLLMHEKHKAWKRKIGFDRIKTAAEMDEKRSRTSISPVPNPFCYRNMVIPRLPHTPDEFALEMKVDVEGLRIEIILLQPASSQCDPSPRRAAVDTGSEEPGTPQQSAAISTGSEEPGTPLQSPVIGTESEEPGVSRVPFETSMNGFLHSNFTITEQGSALLHQQDVGVDDDDKETTATTQQAAIREEFVSPTEKLQRQGTTTWATEQHKLFNRGRPL